MFISIRSWYSRQQDLESNRTPMAISIQTTHYSIYTDHLKAGNV